MPWYYAENGQQNGPLKDGEFEQLVAAGTIRPETSVWREGMANWQAYREIAAQAFPGAPSAAPETFFEAPGAFCSQCGNPFSPEDMLRYEGVYVCATCKPSFFQKIREGIRVSTALRYAGFKIRFGAKLIDGAIIWVAQLVLSFLVGALLIRHSSPSMAIATQALLLFIQILMGAGYSCWFLVKFGATPGKMACRLKIVMPDGGSISFGRALGRHFAEMLSGMIFLIGYIMAGFDEEKRALHDRICNTRVVYA